MRSSDRRDGEHVGFKPDGRQQLTNLLGKATTIFVMIVGGKWEQQIDEGIVQSRQMRIREVRRRPAKFYFGGPFIILSLFGFLKSVRI